MSRVALGLLLLAVPVAYAAGRSEGPLEVRVSTFTVASACVRSPVQPQPV